MPSCYPCLIGSGLLHWLLCRSFLPFLILAGLVKSVLLDFVQSALDRYPWLPRSMAHVSFRVNIHGFRNAFRILTLRRCGHTGVGIGRWCNEIRDGNP